MAAHGHGGPPPPPPIQQLGDWDRVPAKPPKSAYDLTAWFHIIVGGLLAICFIPTAFTSFNVDDWDIIPFIVCVIWFWRGMRRRPWRKQYKPVKKFWPEQKKPPIP